MSPALTHPEVPTTAGQQQSPNGLPPKPPPVAQGKALQISQSSGINLCSLESSAALQQLYIRYPKLGAQLKEIYDSTAENSDHSDDDEDNQSVRGRGYRGRGRGRGGNRGRGNRRNQLKGPKAGLSNLKRLRELQGDDGEGLREFCRLITGLNDGKIT
ncbi:hypothetical protein ACLMJK_005384 [Lecanora helva]